MEKLQFESSEYKLYSPNSLKYITDNMHFVLLSKINQYKELFNIESFRQIQINYFDDIDKFREFVYQISNNRLPKYATGTYHKGMINAYMPTNLEKGSIGYNDRLFVANHELFHIMYNELVLNNDDSKRIVWYDEGMAQLISGEKDDLLDIDKFKEYYLIVKNQTKEFPRLNKLNHGESFVNDLYNGYDLSYLFVRYLKEVLSEEEFKSLLMNPSKVLEYGEMFIYEVFRYYDDQIFLKEKSFNHR